MPPLAGIPKSKAYNHPIASQTDELKYRTKYRQLKAKCSGLEEENVKLQIEIFQTKRSIQRMRLERSILYEYLSEKRAPLHNNTVATQRQPQVAEQEHGMNVNENGQNGQNGHHHRQNAHPVTLTTTVNEEVVIKTEAQPTTSITDTPQ